MSSPSWTQLGDFSPTEWLVSARGIWGFAPAQRLSWEDHREGTEDADKATKLMMASGVQSASEWEEGGEEGKPEVLVDTKGLDKGNESERIENSSQGREFLDAQLSHVHRA